MRLEPRAGLLFVVSAPSGAGKTSLVNALLKQDARLLASVSHTTRPQRPGEQAGQDYHFTPETEFRRMVAQGDFLEHAHVFGYAYGTAKPTVDQALAKGDDVVLEIDWQGAEQVRKLYPQCTSIFILPPSRAALLERLRARGQDSDDVIGERTAKAVEEMRHHGAFDYLVVNDHFDKALQEIQTIVAATRLRRAPQQECLQSLLKELLKPA